MTPAGKLSYRQPKASTSTSPSTFPKRRPIEQRNPEGVPGLSKIKASIRQTKRLLAKENLDPAKRVATQRRLTALEADLLSAEKRDVEKKNGAKYHMVKFVERQKLLRLIRRFQKDLSAENCPEAARIKRELEDARIMLNYVLHFPNTQKYIALFPAVSTSSTAPEPRLTLPQILPSPFHSSPNPETLDATSKTRLEMLNSTRKMMLSGQLSSVPEEGLGSGEDTDKSGRKDRVVIGATEREVSGMGKNGKGSEGKSGRKDKAVSEEADDFFDVED